MSDKLVVSELLDSALKDSGFKKFYEAGEVRRALARALIIIRKSAGLTQSELGGKLELPQSTIARLEGDSTDALKALERIGRIASECDTFAMLFFTDKETGEVKSALSISESAEAQQLAKQMEGLSLKDLPNAAVLSTAIDALGKAIRTTGQKVVVESQNVSGSSSKQNVAQS
jgi:transcriptional regulator with XRE-family HTH domain